MIPEPILTRDPHYPTFPTRFDLAPKHLIIDRPREKQSEVTDEVLRAVKRDNEFWNTERSFT